MRSLVKRFLLPPVLPFLVTLAGVAGVLTGIEPTGALLGAGLLLFYLATIPFVGEHLRAALRRHVPPTAAPEDVPPGAIIVLSGDRARGVDGAVDFGPLTLARVRHAARLHRETGLPLLVAGRSAHLMAATLGDTFGIEPAWIEDRSRRTRENAAFAATMLRDAGIEAAWVVTQDWHLPRALRSFEQAGFTALPAPASLSESPPLSLDALLPSPRGVEACHYGCYEILGLIQQRIAG